MPLRGMPFEGGRVRAAFLPAFYLKRFRGVHVFFYKVYFLFVVSLPEIEAFSSVGVMTPLHPLADYVVLPQAAAVLPYEQR